MFRPLIPILLALGLAACASTPAYGPSTGPNAAGYSETQVENNRYFVTYRAPRGADVMLLQDYALLRAADLTLQSGRDWFIVDRRTTDESSGRSSGPSLGVGVGGGSFGGRSGGSVGVGINIPLGGGGGARASAVTLEIRTGQGAKPDDANAYDARALSQSLRTRISAAS